MRDQILKLHTLPEAEQVEWLVNRNYLSVRGSTGGENDETIYESLADCAFRLRDEFDDLWRFGVITHELLVLIGAKKPVFQAKPIHWIQAALLAKEATHDKEGER